MNILKKIWYVLSGSGGTSTVNREKAEEELNNFICRMEAEVKKAKIDVAEAIALKNVCENKYNEMCSEVEEYIRNSELAVQRGESELAGQALKKAEENKLKKEEYGKELKAQEKAVEELKVLLASLEERLDTTRAQRDLLLTRSRDVEARRQINSVDHQLKGMESEKAFENLEAKVDRIEAEANAMAEIDRLK